MALNPDQMNRLSWLLGKQRSGQILTPWEQEEVRRLISLQQPGAKELNWDALVKLGLLLLGLWVLLGLLKE